MIKTWRFWDGRSPSRTSAFFEGIRLGFANFNRYFQIQFNEVALNQPANLYVKVGDLTGYRLPNNTAALIAPNIIAFGLHVGGDREHIMMTLSHELTHYFGLNLHQYNAQLRGNLVIGQNATRNWTKVDVAYLAQVGVHLQLKLLIPPWEDLLWWRENVPPPPPPPPPLLQTYSWTNEKNKYDANGDGHVSALDALLVNNMITRGEQVDISRPAAGNVKGRIQRIFPDVNADGKLSATDVLQIINELSRQDYK